LFAECVILATPNSKLPSPHPPRLVLEKTKGGALAARREGEPSKAGPLEAWKARLASYSISAANSEKLGALLDGSHGKTMKANQLKTNS
jgi:hypothetical protein